MFPQATGSHAKRGNRLCGEAALRRPAFLRQAGLGGGNLQRRPIFHTINVLYSNFGFSWHKICVSDWSARFSCRYSFSRQGNPALHWKNQNWIIIETTIQRKNVSYSNFIGFEWSSYLGMCVFSFVNSVSHKASDELRPDLLLFEVRTPFVERP